MPQPRTPRSPDTLERARYFARQAVLPADLNQDREYLLHRLRRHNRILHGWGIWSGLRAEPVPPRPDKDDDPAMSTYQAFDKKVGGVPMSVDPKAVTWLAIAPGYALTPLGDEIYLPVWVFVNTVCEVDGGLVTAPASCRAMAARKVDREKEKLVLVVEALEHETGPVRTAGHRCGDHADQFEFSRVEDVLRFRLLRKEDIDPVVDPYLHVVKDQDAKDKVRLKKERRVTGRVWREYVRLAEVVFKEGRVNSVESATGNRDWFEATEPDKPEAPAPREGGAQPVV